MLVLRVVDHVVMIMFSALCSTLSAGTDIPSTRHAGHAGHAQKSYDSRSLRSQRWLVVPGYLGTPTASGWRPAKIPQIGRGPSQETRGRADRARQRSSPHGSLPLRPGSRRQGAVFSEVG